MLEVVLGGFAVEDLVELAWSGFQASKWGGVQAINFSDAGKARTDSNALTDIGGTLTSIDVALFVAWLEEAEPAFTEGNPSAAVTGEGLAPFLYRENINNSGSYLDIDRSDDVIFIQITLNRGRSTDQKKALYSKIAERLSDSLDVRPQDVVVSLIEVQLEDWSLGNGEGQYA